MSQDQTPILEAEVVPTSRWRGLLRFALVTLWLVALFAGCLWLYTRNNTFPIEFHPDEPGKAQQVVQNVRNFRHPQLMLEATDIWRRWIGDSSEDMQVAAVAGRQVSAFFGAAAVTMLALTAYLCAGWWGLVIGSILMGLCPPILTYSHYMKEDASLLVGVAMVILASRVVWLTRRWWSRIPAWGFLALGCAVAASGKYVGAMTIVMPVVLIFAVPGFRWYRPILRLILFVPLVVLLVGLINHRALNPSGLDFAAVARDPSQWQILLDPSFLEGLQGEVEHSATSHWGLTAPRPNSYVVRTAISQSWPVPFILACALPAILVLTWHRGRGGQGWGWEVVLILFSAACAMVLSYSVILFPRYALPITAMVFFMAAIAASRLVAACSGRPVAQGTLGCLVSAALIALFLPVCLDYTRQFGHDSRYAVSEWLVRNLPRNARVYADGYAEISDYGPTGLAGKRSDIQISGSFFLGQMPGLRYEINRGEAYFVICDLAYGRFFEPSMIPTPGWERRARSARDFYENLLTKQKPVWSAVPKWPMQAFTNPTIYVYKLTPEMLKGLGEGE